MVTSDRLALCGVHGSPAAAASCDLERARDPAHVHDVRLHDVDRAHVDHARPGREVPVLLAAGHVERERLGDLPGLVELPVGAGLLVVADALRLEEPSDLDRAARREAAVGVDELRDAVAERARHRRHDRLGASRPLIDVVTALGTDAPLERVEAQLIAQAHEPRAPHLLGGDVAAHGGGIGAQARGVPPSSSTTGLPSSLPRRSQSAVSRPGSARQR